MKENYQLINDKDNKPLIVFLDKELKKEDVGSKLSDFIVEKKLGEGHFGSVYLVTSKITKKLYALKEIIAKRYRSEAQRLAVEREIKLLENLHHPHVITYYNSFREKDNFYIITEYINGGSLLDLLRKNIEDRKLIEEKTIWYHLVQSLSGLVYLHEKKKIIHRDVKPDNILLNSDGRLKISDFGVSAIDSEEVEDLIKCHGTVAGPIQFMAPEMALGGTYDFKSDIYMLGITFFMMMSNQYPERKIVLGPMIIPVKNDKAKLPESYSLTLRSFIHTLLAPPDDRPTAQEAYSSALSYYFSKYLKVTSIFSSLECLISIPTFISEIGNIKIENNNKTDNEYKNNVVLEVFKDCLKYANPNKFNYDSARDNCLKLRLLLYTDDLLSFTNLEIDVHDFIPYFLTFLHKLLNNVVGSNSEEENKIDYTKEKEVLSLSLKTFQEKYKTKLIDNFFYISKTIIECNKCKKSIKYATDIFCACSMKPERAALFLKKKNLNIIDLFKHYEKARLYKNENEYCEHCKEEQHIVNKIKKFYTSPTNLILEIDYENEKNFILNIDEKINIQEFVENKDKSKVNYTLVAAIFSEKKENGDIKYVSFSKNQKGGWNFYNGKTLQNCRFKDLANHNQLKVLFYVSQ